MTSYVYIVSTDQGPEASYPNPALAVEHLRVHHVYDNPDRDMGTTMATGAPDLETALSKGGLVMVTDMEQGLIATAERQPVREVLMPAEDIQQDDASKAIEVLALVRSFIAARKIKGPIAYLEGEINADGYTDLLNEVFAVAGYHVDDERYRGAFDA